MLTIYYSQSLLNFHHTHVLTDIMPTPAPQVEVTPENYHIHNDVVHSRGRMPLKHPQLLPPNANQSSLGHHAGESMPMYTQSGGGGFTAYDPHTQHSGNVDISKLAQFVTSESYTTTDLNRHTFHHQHLPQGSSGTNPNQHTDSEVSRLYAPLLCQSNDG